MGYYSNFKVSIEKDAKVDIEEVAQNLESISDYRFKIVDSNKMESTDQIKWYDCQEDMLRLAEKYPTITFLVEVEGEESGDLWRLYVRGKEKLRVKPAIVWPEVSFYR